MPTIRKRGDRWQAQIRRQGMSPHSKSFSSKRDATVWARQVEAQADRREFPADGKSLQLVTLAQLIGRYRDEVSVTKRGIEVEQAILGRFLRHPMCVKRLSELSAQDFAAYRDERLEEIKPTSLRRQLVILHNVFEIARNEWGTDTQVKSFKPKEKRYRRSDGGGLFVDVMPSGRKVFRLAYRNDGKQRTAWIGDYPTIRLADARLKVGEFKRALRAGIDPNGPPAKTEPDTKEADIEPSGPLWRDIARDYLILRQRSGAEYRTRGEPPLSGPT